MIDRKWTSKYGKSLNGKRNVKKNCTETIRDFFIASNDQMEHIQKKVEEYLDEKRTEFPRLYFISNDELLNLLSQADSTGIEPHLNKLFD